MPLTTLQQYVPMAMVLAAAALLGLTLLGLANLLGPRRPSAVKSTAFECGSLPLGDARQRFDVKFYVVALLFIVFDIEAVFIYPWAVVMTDLGWPGYVTMAVFAFTLVVGLVYVWKKGALDWSRE
ncbi:MAG TPA: NADH-quinone oxidoreductase subunit A [Anaeromyxobacteraceae bacterium]|nr:NADH-quinone oxidoreductase subunit A [Anaeromyxobacteraceae bacterium]